MLSCEAARARVLAALPPRRRVRVAPSDALGLVLAEAVRAPGDLPRFDNSAVDGYAVRGAGPWRLVGRAEAGRPFARALRAREAVRVLTGAPVPRGTHGVVMQEDAVVASGQLTVARGVPAGRHIRLRGEDVRRGALVLRKGIMVRPEEVGLLAGLGLGTVAVWAPPRAAVLTTGSELAAPGTRPGPGGIHDACGPLLRALLAREGVRTAAPVRVRDTQAAVARALRTALAGDLVLLTGGVSVGDRDHVRAVAARCGVRERFWRVSIKPGMPVFFGTRGRTLVFGLPGNPVSAFVTFTEFVLPALRRLLGRPATDAYAERGRLTAPLTVSRRRQTHFVRARCHARGTQIWVRPLADQGSHVLRTLVEADGWIRVRSDRGPLGRGLAVPLRRAA